MAEFSYPTTGEGWQAVTPTGQHALAALAADPAGTLLASDFDGTLARIVDDPADARMTDRARAALDRLGPVLGQLAIVSGRGVEVLRRLTEPDRTPGLDHLIMLGLYGQERWDQASRTAIIPDAPDAIREAADSLATLLASPPEDVDLSGVVLEDKVRSVAVHTRRAVHPEESWAWLHKPVAALADRLGLHLEPGRHVLELRGSQVTKGEAILALVEETGARVVVMMGDDLGDLPALNAVAHLEHAHGVRVVAASAEQTVLATSADILCDGPDGVAAWLEALADALAAD